MLDGLQYEIVPAEPGDIKGASFFSVPAKNCLLLNPPQGYHPTLAAPAVKTYD